MDAEDFVDDGDDIGDVDGAVVVEVALFVGEGDYHLGVGWDGAGEGVTPSSLTAEKSYAWEVIDTRERAMMMAGIR